MASFDYDVVIIGSRFGGSVAALPTTDKRYRRSYGVLQALEDEDIPRGAAGSVELLVNARGGVGWDPEDLATGPRADSGAGSADASARRLGGTRRVLPAAVSPPSGTPHRSP